MAFELVEQFYDAEFKARYEFKIVPAEFSPSVAVAVLLEDGPYGGMWRLSGIYEFDRHGKAYCPEVTAQEAWGNDTVCVSNYFGGAWGEVREWIERILLSKLETWHYSRIEVGRLAYYSDRAERLEHEIKLLQAELETAQYAQSHLDGIVREQARRWDEARGLSRVA